MRNYDYLHESITDGNSASAGRTYRVLRSSNSNNRKLVGTEMLATKMTADFEDGTARLFVNVQTGGYAYFGNDTIVV